MPPERILILGGTREAAELAATLVADGHTVTTSLAGRTREPKPVAGAIRIGGFGGAAGLAAYLAQHGIDRLIDATHPFAGRISANARIAAGQAGVPLDIRLRLEWERRPGDDWRIVNGLTQAMERIPENAIALLALGSQYIAPFAARRDVTFVVRMVDPPVAPLPLPHHRLLVGRPSPAAVEEKEMLENEGIDTIVCRNSGGPGAYAKIEAARMLRLPVIMIARPAPEEPTP